MQEGLEITEHLSPPWFLCRFSSRVGALISNQSESIMYGCRYHCWLSQFFVSIPSFLELGAWGHWQGFWFGAFCVYTIGQVNISSLSVNSRLNWSIKHCRQMKTLKKALRKPPLLLHFTESADSHLLPTAIWVRLTKKERKVTWEEWNALNNIFSLQCILDSIHTVLQEVWPIFTEHATTPAYCNRYVHFSRTNNN